MKRPPHSLFHSNHGRGFSVAELLIVVAVMAILAVLLTGVVNRARMEAKIVKCMANLRASGLAVLAHAGENRGRSVVAFGGVDSHLISNPELAISPQFGKYWMIYLHETGYLKDLRVVACPVVSPYYYRYESGYTQQAYGLRRWRDTPFRPAAIQPIEEHQESFILLADSVIWPGGTRPSVAPEQRYYVTYPGNRQDRIHARHNGRANVFLLNGSVRSLTAKQMAELDPGWDDKSIDDSIYPNN